ncbi:MAG: VPLPA-CTERM sorting domain-containing protein [Pseudomonadota bacterium]
MMGLASAGQAASISQTFGPIYGFADGPGSVSTLVTGLDSNITSDLTIDFTVIGDLRSASTENFTLSIDGTAFGGNGCNNNTGDDSFGLVARGSADDRCDQNGNRGAVGQLVIDQASIAPLLSDGRLNLTFSYGPGADNGIRTSAAFDSSGVTFGIQSTFFAFGAGGTISYDTDTTAVIPLPAGAPLLLTGLAALALRRHRCKRRV